LTQSPPVMGRKVNPYLYPPPSLLAFWPLAKLSLANGFAVFTIISHLCFLGSIWLILARLTPLPRDQGLRGIALCISLVYMLCSDAVSTTFWLGQVNLIVLFFICLSLAALKDGAPNWRIALPLSIAILLKTYPVLLLVPLLFRKRFRAVAFTCLFFGLFTAVAVLVLPVEVWSSYFTKVLPAGGYASNQIGSAAPWNQSISGFVTRLLLENNFIKTPLSLPYMAKPVATVLALIVMSVTMFSSFHFSWRGDSQRSAADEIAAFLLMIYLIAPLSWDHHVVYVLPAAVLAIVLVISGATRGFLTAALVLALFLIGWKLPLDHPALNNGWWTLLISVKFYSVVVLWCFFLKRMHAAKVNQRGGSAPDAAALATASA
jgi:Glycosyltransferase family 87